MFMKDGRSIVLCRDPSESACAVPTEQSEATSSGRLNSLCNRDARYVDFHELAARASYTITEKE